MITEEKYKELLALAENLAKTGKNELKTWGMTLAKFKKGGKHTIYPSEIALHKAISDFKEFKKRESL